jgi:hypothetical protein
MKKVFSEKAVRRAVIAGAVIALLLVLSFGAAAVIDSCAVFASDKAWARLLNENEQRVERAQTEARITRIRADAEAYAIAKLAEQLVLNPDVIDYIEAARRNGVSTVIYE